jgi:hypothetical protein
VTAIERIRWFRQLGEDRVSHVEWAGRQRSESPMANSEKLYLSIAELRDFYDVERQLTRALAKLPQGASWFALRDAFEAHLTETRREINRLERVVEGLWEMIRNHRDDVPPVPDTTVRISVRSGASTGPTGVQHRREDYGDHDDTLVAWARAIGDHDPGDDGTDDLLETGSDETGPEPSTDN